LKKEKAHDCPTDMIFSDKKGRCVNPNLENLNLRSKSAPNLRFKKMGGEIKLAVELGNEEIYYQRVQGKKDHAYIIRKKGAE